MYTHTRAQAQVIATASNICDGPNVVANSDNTTVVGYRINNGFWLFSCIFSMARDIYILYIITAEQRSTPSNA